MKFGFVTCVELGLSCINAIYSIRSKLKIIVTLKDEIAVNKSGRVYLDKFCEVNNVKLIKCHNINEDFVSQAIMDAEIDWLFIIGWSQIAGIGILNSVKEGVLGIHPTLLPIGRGRASVPWAILLDLKKTGVTLFKLDGGVDTGAIALQVEIPIDSSETATTLYAKVNEAHKTLIKESITLLKKRKLIFKKQDETKATIWPKRKPSDGIIEENSSVYFAEKMVRALTHPYPGAFLDYENYILKIWKAKIVDSSFNKKVVTFTDGKLELLEYEFVKKSKD